MHLLPLSQLAPGQSGEIDQLVGDPQMVHRMQEMGLRVGARVEMVRRGDPCIVRVAQTRLCVRENGTLRVLVRWEGSLMTAAELAVGQSGRVVEIIGTDAIAVRLMEMGLTPGVSIKLLGTAPLGDPLELQVRGYRLSLRRSEAARVQLVVDETTNP